MLTPRRIYVEELLDAGVGTDLDVAANLADLRMINRLGGSKVVLRALRRVLESGETGRELSLLDVGTGSADIPNTVLSWCKEAGLKPRIAALDVSERNLRVARGKLGIEPEIDLVLADATSMPFEPGTFDFVTASLMLHHFKDDDVVRLLSVFGRLARRAVIVNDLVRNLVPYYFIRATAPVLARSFLTRHDGPVSVLRGFTASELRDMALAAGLNNCQVERVFPYRLLLVARTASGAG